MRKERLEQLLREALQPHEIEIQNDSKKHHGHAGDDGSGQTHFQIRIRSAQFKGLSLLEQHRRVYAIIEPEFKQGLHALVLDTGV